MKREVPGRKRTAPRRRGPFADPGYQPDKRKRYQLDTHAHIAHAWSLIHWPSHAAKYTAGQLRLIRGRIQSAARRRGMALHSGSARRR